MKLGNQILIFTVLLSLLLVSTNIVIADGCSGIIATGDVVKDGRSILTKNRHLPENNQIPTFGQGTYSYWGIGDGVHSFCRMGLNEKGVAIVNFNPPVGNMIDDGIWQFISDNISASEDDDLRTVLGEYTTVEEAAMWLAQHASYPCQWGIISQESGIGAIVAMDANFHSHITYIKNDWAAIGNVWHCEDASSGNNRRIDYLIDGHFINHDTIDVRDVVRLIGRDIKKSDSDEAEPVGYTGNYSASGLSRDTSRSAVAFISGDDSFDGALSMAWVGIGQTTHLCAFFPLGASYVHTADDIPTNWTAGIGLEQYTDVKQAYAQASPNVYYRDRVHEIYNYTLPIQEAIFDRYDALMDAVKNSSSNYDAQEQLKAYADSIFEDGLQAYIEERPMMSDVVTPDPIIPDETPALPLNLLIILSFVFTICIIVFLFIYLLFRD